MKKPSLQSHVIDILEVQLELAQKQLEQARQDIEFYRGKVERLELAIMSNPPAQQDYVQSQTVFERVVPDAKEPKSIIPPRIPFKDLKRAWSAMTVEEQEKAMVDGWELEKGQVKEETNAGE